MVSSGENTARCQAVRRRQRAGFRTLMMTCFSWPSPWLSDSTSS
jgi:hypothetical protein